MKKLKYGNYTIRIVKELRDGKILAEIGHKSHLNSLVLFRDGKAINNTAVEMYNDAYDNRHFSSDKRKLIRDYERESKEANEYFDNIRKNWKSQPSELQKKKNSLPTSLVDMDDKELDSNIYGNGLRDYNQDWLINKVIRDNEHKGLKIRDSFTNMGVEPRDLNAILSKLRGFLRGEAPLKDEDEAKKFIAEFLSAFKKSGGKIIEEMY